MMRKILAATLALSLGTTATLAQSTLPSASAAPASERVSGSGQFGEGGSYVVAAIAGLIVILGILAATDTWPFDDDDEEPISP